MCNKKEICYFCGSELIDNGYRENEIFIPYDERDVLCPLCGYYHFSEKVKLNFKDYRNEIAHYLYFKNVNKNEITKKLLYIPVKENNRFNLDDGSNEYKKYISIDEIKAFYPYKFSEKVNKCIIALTIKAETPGNKVIVTFNELADICCIKREYNEDKTIYNDFNSRYICNILYYLAQISLINNGNVRNGINEYVLEPKIWLRAEELENSNINNKDIFVAMEFSSNTKDIREYVREGISNAGFNPLFIDEEIHCEQIMPYMLRKIKESRFLIMETTFPNNGAYYEAGYAEALGKQVIICCRKDKFEDKKIIKEGEEEIKEKSVHFDIAQKNLIIWNEPEELTKKIEKWLEALS